MKVISAKDFEKITENASVLSKDRHGLKVLQSADGFFIKIFRLKNKISSARFDPYARRFARNAEILSLLSIPTVEVIDSFVVPEIERDAVVYKPLEGETLREKVAGGDPENYLNQLPRFLASLHEKGILFRSIHWANIVISTDGNFGLIDIADMQWKNRRLGLWERYRNFRHMIRYPCDRKSLRDFNARNFIRCYFEHSNFHPVQRLLLDYPLNRLFQRS